MITGQLMFLGVVAFLLSQGRQGTALPMRVLLAAEAAVFVFGIVVTLAARWWGFRGVRTEADLRARYTTRLIVPMAVLEGASFFAIVLVMLTARWMPMALFVAGSLAMQGTLFPPARVPAELEQDVARGDIRRDRSTDV